MNIDLRFGDGIEALQRDWIIANVPEYEILWSRFIGHDGNGHPLGVELTSITQENRVRFYQSHYSAIISLLALKDIAEVYQQSLGQILNIKDYTKANLDLIAFEASAGRLRDLFHKMDNILGLGGAVSNSFDDLYSQRNAVLHGSVPAPQFEAGFLKIPVPVAREAGCGFADEGLWENAPNYEYKFLSDFFRDKVTEVIAKFRGALSRFLDRIKELEPHLSRPLQVNCVIPDYSEGSVMMPPVSGQYMP